MSVSEMFCRHLVATDHLGTPKLRAKAADDEQLKCWLFDNLYGVRRLDGALGPGDMSPGDIGDRTLASVAIDRTSRAALDRRRLGTESFLAAEIPAHRVLLNIIKHEKFSCGSRFDRLWSLDVLSRRNRAKADGRLVIHSVVTRVRHAPRNLNHFKPT